MNTLYPNIPADAFPFEYGSPEWITASFEFHLNFQRYKYELLKNCSNKIPSEEVLDCVYSLYHLPPIIEYLDAIENPTEEENEQNALFATHLDKAKEDLSQYVINFLSSSTTTALKQLANAKHIIQRSCPLDLPLPFSKEDTRIGGVKNLVQTIREIIHDWYGEDPPKDWLITYKEISERHNRSESPPSEDDLKRYLKKVGLETLLIDYRQS